MRALQLGCRFLVETLAHAKDKTSLAAWSQLLQTGLHKCLPACRWLLLEAEAAGTLHPAWSDAARDPFTRRFTAHFVLCRALVAAHATT